MIANITNQHIILENERVQLRPLQESDFNHLLTFALNEPELWTYSFISGAGEAGLEQYIRIATENRTAGKEYPFIIFDKQANRYAGSTRFYDIQPSHDCAQLGFTWYGSAFHRTGLNRHCKWLLLNFAFEEWKLERLEFRADARNQRSINAMKAIGCREEGILRSHMALPDGSRRDSIVLSILRNEWIQGLKEQLQKKKY